MGPSPMTKTKLDDALQGVNRLGLDTAPIIYFIESNPQYDVLLTEVFRRISNGGVEALCSVITLTRRFGAGLPSISDERYRTATGHRDSRVGTGRP